MIKHFGPRDGVDEFVDNIDLFARRRNVVAKLGRVLVLEAVHPQVDDGLGLFWNLLNTVVDKRVFVAVAPVEAVARHDEALQQVGEIGQLAKNLQNPRQRLDAKQEATNNDQGRRRSWRNEDSRLRRVHKHCAKHESLGLGDERCQDRQRGHANKAPRVQRARLASEMIRNGHCKVNIKGWNWKIG